MVALTTTKNLDIHGSGCHSFDIFDAAKSNRRFYQLFLFTIRQCINRIKLNIKIFFAGSTDKLPSTALMSNKENDLTSSNEVDTEDDLNNISSREELSLRLETKTVKKLPATF